MMGGSTLLSPEATAGFLATQRIVRVAFDAAGERYLIPLGYVWLDNALWCLTTEGRKTRMAAINPKVSFQVDDSSQGSPFEWTSVTGEGMFEVVVGRAAALKVLPALLRRFPDAPAWARGLSMKLLANGDIVALRIRPLVMTGRRMMPPDSA
jgi:nitroimidazol reductase NimA-like FMN-containing flavoprotein (pyridoxamine 5'-phosphate oxidase superfamily)